MTRRLRIFAFLSALWFLSFLELANYYPQRLLIWELTALIWPLIFLSILLVKIKKQKLPIHSLGLPLIFLLMGVFLALLFIDRSILRQVFIIFVSLFLYWGLYYLALFAWRAKEYVVGNLEQINLGILGLATFLLAVSFFGWLTFLAQSVWPILLVAAILFFLIFLEIFFLRKIEGRQGYLYSLILTVLAVEFFWSISLWPIGFKSKGLIFSLILLFLSYLSQNRLLGVFNKRKAVGYLIMVAVLISAILGMTRWI